MGKYKLLIKSNPKGVLKAQFGLGTPPTSTFDPNAWRKGLLGDGSNGATLNNPTGQPMGFQQYSAQTPTINNPSGLFGDMSKAAPEITNLSTDTVSNTGTASSVGNLTSAGIGTGIAAAGMIGNHLIEKNRKDAADRFGLVDPDESSIRKSSTLTGASTGASTGMAIGATFGPLGAGIGAVAGGLAGGIMGNISGKKKGDKAQADYEKAHTSALRSEGRYLDSISSARLGEEGVKMRMPYRPAIKIKSFKAGGKLEEPGAINVIAKGKLHRENNNLGNKDKGVPVIDTKGEKEYEIEKEELILRQEATKTVEALVKQFNETQDSDILEKIGEFMSDELLSNTHDYSKKYKVKV